MRSFTDRDVEVTVGNLLRAGVALAAAVVFSDGVVYLWRHGAETAGFHQFHGEPADLKSVRGIIRAAAALRPAGMIQLGLLLLIATPIARVAFSVFAFIRQRDRLYAAITLMVLGLLSYSLFG